MAADRKKSTGKVPSRKPVAVHTETPQHEIPPLPLAQLRPYHIWKFLKWLLARTSVPEIMLIATFIMARYMTNSDFSYPSEIVLDIVLLGVLATGVFYLFKWIFRHRLLPAHIASLLLAYGLYGYGSGYPSLHKFAGKIIPGSATSFTNAILTVLILGIVFGAVGYAIDKFIRHFKALRDLPLLKFLLFVICFVFITQLGKMGLRMWDIRHFLSYEQPAIHLQESADASKASRPNIYYIVLDRYASDTTLSKDYDFDNSDFMDYLSSEGFVNRKDAYANYPFTMMSISSTLAMNYHTALGAEFANQSKDFQPAFPYRQILDNPPVAKALQAKGYEYNHISSWWDFTRKIPSADGEPTLSYRLRIFGKTFWLSDLQRDIVNKSILSPLLLKGMTVGHTAIIKYDLDRNPVQNFNAEISAVKKIAGGSKSENAPQFTFAHILSPHDPYIFDENGENPTYSHERDDNGVDETVKYTNQLTYLNKRIKDLIGTIRREDPKAVVVIQADEGPYPKQFRGTLTSSHYYDPITLPLEQMRQKTGILASYYMPGVDADTLAAKIPASVDTFRFVLSQYAGYELSTLPDCNFSNGDKFHLYNYQLITGKLKGTANPAACGGYK
jgi:hypothetical protein